MEQRKVIEVLAKALRRWLEATGKTLYIEPCRRGRNSYCESFNLKLGDEFLNGEISTRSKTCVGSSAGAY